MASPSAVVSPLQTRAAADLLELWRDEKFAEARDFRVQENIEADRGESEASAYSADCADVCDLIAYLFDDLLLEIAV